MIYYIIDTYRFYGWLGILALIWPVYWTQDLKWVNNGIDIISIRLPSKGYYFKGTIWERDKWIDGYH